MALSRLRGSDTPSLAAGDLLNDAVFKLMGNTPSIQAGVIAAAIDKLNQAIERTNGCETSGVADGNGPGRDWVTSCVAQPPILASLRAARDALAR